MAAYTSTYAIDNTREYPVLCHLDGIMRIAVQENFNSATPPTADLLQRGAAPGSAQVDIVKGTPAIFASGPYSAGQQVGTIQTASGSITVQQVESKTL